MYRWTMTSSFMLGLFLAAFPPGCGGGGGQDCVPGTETCSCVEGACATGLACASGYCVNLADSSGDAGDLDTGDGHDSGDGEGDDSGEDLCQHFLDCVKEVQPEGLSAYTVLYGPNGGCYDIEGLTKEDCWAECDALRETLAGAFPNTAACGPINCGDEKLDMQEMCDGGNGCTATCLWAPFSNNECSPITQVGCDLNSERCSIKSSDFENSFYCEQNFSPPTESGSVNDGCYYAAQCAYAPNAFCMYRPDCVDDSCCTNLCYLGATDLDVVDCPPGFGCVSVEDLYANSFPNGSELVGVCWPT